jgi:four helix bundle protein
MDEEMDLERPQRDFTDLDLWIIARQLKNEIFELVQRFPADERFRLTDQMIRCSRSINSNIAEGHGNILTKINCTFAS